MSASPISETGLSVVHEPEDGVSLVDIVFVHGLQGHPHRTWATKKAIQEDAGRIDPQPSTVHTTTAEVAPNEKQKHRNILRRLIPQRQPSQRDTIQRQKDKLIFWPADLLPPDCPKARIMTFGYDTKVTKYMKGGVNKNSIFSHGKDFLFALRRKRVLGRPIIFVAHSLGGIVVKDMLASSHISAEADARDIVGSTAAVFFLGTPHRGSKDLASTGEIVRKVASAIMMDTNPGMLDALGLRDSTLERCQESFSALWRQYDFRVKTFQESLPLTGINLGLLGELVVPPYSSLLGDPRENAETLQANHRNMCRFSHRHDPDYGKVAGEITSVVKSIGEEHQVKSPHQAQAPQATDSTAKKLPVQLSSIEKACLQSLRFPNMGNRLQSIDIPLEQTCSWLFETLAFTRWWNNEDPESHLGLLWLKGKPGSGKSTLMKNAFRYAEHQRSEDMCVAGVFLDARGGKLERSPLGLYRSLLYQLLPQSSDRLQEFRDLFVQKEKEQGRRVEWHEGELKGFLELVLTRSPRHKTVIFVDAIDECIGDSGRELAFFFRNLTVSAFNAGADLSVCLSSRQYPTVNVSSCPEVIVQDCNGPDLKRYVRKRFATGALTDDQKWSNLEEVILDRSAGVFLWVVLVVDMLLKDRDAGKNNRSLQNRLNRVPQPLEDLFAQLLKDIDGKERQTTIRLFQWVVLAERTMRLREWHHILAFIKDQPPRSLREWQDSDEYTEVDEQLEWQIRSISKGLVEIRTRTDTGPTIYGTEEWDSVRGGAGSMDEDQGEARVVEVIHDSVRDFFMNGGFSYLDPSLKSNPLGRGHLSIIQTCLDYTQLRELDPLIEGRMNATSLKSTTPPPSVFLVAEGEPEPGPAPQVNRRMSSASFGSSASDYAPSVASNHSVRSLQGVSSSRIPLSPSLGVSLTSDPQNGPTTHGTADVKAQPHGKSSIARFLEEATTCASTEIIAKAASISSATRSQSVRSKTLETFPVLLSYVSDMIFIHAVAAEKQGADATEVVTRMSDQHIWARWKALKEDMPSKTTLLYHVAQCGLVSWMQCLLNMGCSPNVEGGFHCYPLIAAANSDHEEALIFLKSYGAKADVRDKLQRTALHHIAATNTLSQLRAFWACVPLAAAATSIDLLAYQRDLLDVRDIFGQTPLHLATWYSDALLVRELLEYGSNVDTKDRHWDTPLHFALGRQPHDEELCRVLLAAEPDVLAKNNRFQTPLDAAVAAKNRVTPELARLLRPQQHTKNRMLSPSESGGNLCVRIIAGRGLPNCQQPRVMMALQACTYFLGYPRAASVKWDFTKVFEAGVLGSRALVLSVFDGNTLVESATFDVELRDYEGRPARTWIHLAAALGNKSVTSTSKVLVELYYTTDKNDPYLLQSLQDRLEKHRRELERIKLKSTQQSESATPMI